MTPEVKSRKILRFSKELGLHYLDRGKSSCKWSTEFCRSKCYYNKFMIYPQMRGYLQRAELAWQSVEPAVFQDAERIRLCKVGDPFKDYQDIERVALWAKANPSTKFWAPTRAWRNAKMKARIEKLFDIPNLHIMASIDPSNTKEELDDLAKSGWSTMFFGNDEEHPIGAYYKCPKTWEKTKGSCGSCTRGCFNNKQVHVWLKKH